MADEKLSVDSVFCAAIEIESAEERQEYVAKACGQNSELLRQVDRLLRAHFGAGSFLESPPDGVAASPTLDQPVTERPGTVIGPYKLLQEIGQGGMGVVYMAEQTEPVERRVALKIIKPGMDTRQVIARFEAERQALAMMDHPNIAKVLDAGTTDRGRPFFVMELVKGVPITRYCDENHLTAKERLELFVPVCRAVQHAHQKGIIHRDIKPSNMLVALYDDRPVPKVIDFGVAKAISQRLSEKTMFTQYGQVVGTVEYMSPEQAQLNQMDIDTRSDIYSLGVLLYELLSGQTPFDRQRLRSAAFDEVLRIVREEDPPRPSVRLSSSVTLPSIAANRQIEPRKLSALVRGDLGWIVMKTLEKDRTRRYETANGLAADIERYLNEEPVVACPPSASYRFKKFARRNRGALLTTSVVAVAMLLIVGTIASSIGWAVRNRVAIEEQVAREQAAQELVIKQTVESALKTSTEHMQAKNWPPALAEARRAEAAASAGKARGELRQQVDERLRDLTMVTRLEEVRIEQRAGRKTTADHAAVDQKYNQAFCEYGLDLQNLDAEKAAAWMRGRTIAEELAVAVDHWAEVRRYGLKLEETSWRHLVAVARAADVDPLRSRLRGIWAQPVAEQADSEFAQLTASDHIGDLSPTTLCLLARVLGRAGREQDAISVLRQAQTTYPSDLWINIRLATSLRKQATKTHVKRVGGSPLPEGWWKRNELGDVVGPVRFYTAAVALRPESSRLRTELGTILAVTGDLDGAVQQYKRAMQLDPKDAKPHVNLGTVQKTRGDLEGAIREYKKAIELEPELPTPHFNLATVLMDKGAFEEAIRELVRTLAIDPKNLGAQVNLGIALSRNGDLDGGIRELRKAVELEPEDSTLHNNLGWALQGAGDLDGAIRAFRKAIDLDPGRAIFHTRLGDVLRQKGDHAEASQEFNAAVDLYPDPTSRSIADWGHIGQALYGAGRFHEAREALEKVIELSGDDGPAIDMGPRWWYYTMTLWKLGEREIAMAYFRQLEQAAGEDLPETMESLRYEAAVLLGIDSQQTKEPDDVN